MRPPRPDIAAPPLPPGVEWIGEPVRSLERVLAERPALVHFFDFAQLNSVRTLPYLRAWRDRYEVAGLAVVGVHSPRFPFTRSAESVAAALPDLGVDWPVALDPEFAIWRDYEPHGWPSLFLWGKGGALRWHHLGEGEYAATEEAIREALTDAGANGSWPDVLDPLRPADAPDAEVVAPTPELFPGGAIERPWAPDPEQPSLDFEYQAAGAFAAAGGEGEIAISVDGEPREPVAITRPGLWPLAEHERTERHSLELTPSAGVRLHSVQFPAGPPG